VSIPGTKVLARLNRLNPVGGEISSSAPPRRWSARSSLGAPLAGSTHPTTNTSNRTSVQLEAKLISALESHLLECRACREKLSQCIASQLILQNLGWSKSESTCERSEPRFSTGASAILQELSPWSVDRRKVEIVDISKNGIGILSPTSVFPGTIVQVRIRATVELAEVRHCSGCGEIGYRYRIALRLRGEF
jgi:hypothetical protein